MTYSRTRDLRGENIIDSRDVIKRIEDLEDDVETLFTDWLKEQNEIREEGTEELEDCAETRARFNDEHRYEDPVEELRLLKALEDEARGYGDWHHGETLISDDYFERYAEELADDLGLTKDSNQWPYTYIDWEKAADELKRDYTAVEFNGTTYWMRS